MGLTPPDKRPPGATKGFMIRPGFLARREQLLRRELRILEHKIRTRQISGQDAKEQGHTLFEDHFNDILIEVSEEAAQQDLPEVDPENSELQQQLEEAKRSWTKIVDDVLAL